MTTTIIRPFLDSEIGNHEIITDTIDINFPSWFFDLNLLVKRTENPRQRFVSLFVLFVILANVRNFICDVWEDPAIFCPASVRRTNWNSLNIVNIVLHLWYSISTKMLNGYSRQTEEVEWAYIFVTYLTQDQVNTIGEGLVFSVLPPWWDRKFFKNEALDSQEIHRE